MENCKESFSTLLLSNNCFTPLFFLPNPYSQSSLLLLFPITMSSSVPTPAPNNPPPSSPSTASASSNTKLRQRSNRKVNDISLGLATLNQGLAPALSFWKRQGMLLKLAVYGWLLCTWWIFALLALFWIPPAFNLLTIAYVCVYDAPTYVEHLEQAIQDNYGLSFPVRLYWNN